MNALKNARTDLARKCYEGLRDGDGCLPEASDGINNASRRLVQAVADETGEAWLGKFNLYREDREPGPDGKQKPVLWKWDGSLVCNFSCGFVVPHFDAELERLIFARDASQPDGYSAAHNWASLEAIMVRLAEVGGYSLLWT